MKICLNKVYILLVLFFISSCGVKKSVIKELETINVSEIIDKINSRKINSNWLYIKGKNNKIKELKNTSQKKLILTNNKPK